MKHNFRKRHTKVGMILCWFVDLWRETQALRPFTHFPFTTALLKKHILSHYWHVSDSDQYEKTDWEPPSLSVQWKQLLARASGQHDLTDTSLGRADVWTVWCDGPVLPAEADADAPAADRVSACIYQHILLSARKSYHRLCSWSASIFSFSKKVIENHCLFSERNLKMLISTFICGERFA